MKPYMKYAPCWVRSCHYFNMWKGGDHCERPNTNTYKCEIRRRLTKKEFAEEQAAEGVLNDRNSIL